MTKQEIAEKEIEAFKWMKSKGYDRRACKDIAPILVKYSIEQLSIPRVMPRFSEITKDSDNGAFSWILKDDKNGDHSENNSDMIRKLVHRYNDLIKYLNEA